MKETFDTRDIARELARKYSTMTHEELDVLESILVPMKFAKGEMILSEGEVCENIYYIERGLIRQFYFKNGKQITEHLGEDRTIFMCIESLFREEPTKLQVEAIEPTTVYALPKRRLEQVALHNVNIQILYRKILEESLIISQVHADLVRFETAQDRYKKMCKLSPQVILRAPLVYIASYLQMTPETLSRVRAATLLE
ncbi:Crp/Fnr family transcriptional regulator [Prevotella intermedia]|jgi:cyclic nucleotide-binding domain protein|uniref:Crp/Fnr family transcriptional regulator n=2 Tax=Prevotella intermedia TaxID=28131 RepID=A0A0H5B0K2_PREIN|nr:Crp/Fnr family transcriptional regulator [Prevotella intermedia]AFJ09331.1 cyclic nucleotide-binding domain protein [Prevotella intermedia 17]APW31945.1 cyclic nucleotide-binding protein [Prevotella intermedia ATCC 25611 = DSM 20706]APW34665.1 cyclic nucleotide-binding protein [Prevotella intermedia]ATV26812.1 Crp/Fnr family transcriptional regulator [Prevotella intermedia]ATV30910.1 Crp/Fnr family transcriptional regulator [Prevotella intermedia]